MEWFLLNSGRVEGPFKSQLLKDKIEKGELDLSTFVCRQGDPHWKPLEDLREEIINSAKPDEDLKNWILLTENLELALSKEQEGQFVQSGPYTTLEIMDLLQSGQAKYSDFIWKSGFEKWVRINEVDEFFNAPRTEAVAIPEAVAVSEAPVEDSQLLSQVLEQTHLNTLDFVDEEKAPPEAKPIDEAIFKSIEMPEEPTPESQPQFALSSTTIPEVVETSSAHETVARRNPDVIANIFESAQKYFPYLMTGLAAILVIMVGVWALSLTKDDARESAHLPPPAPVKKESAKPVEARRPTVAKPNAKFETVAKPPEIPTAPAVKVERAAPVAKAPVMKPVVKMKPMNRREVMKASRGIPIVKPVDRTLAAKKREMAAKAAIGRLEDEDGDGDELGDLASHLLSRAERLETQYENLKLNPSEWHRFYQAWNSEMQRSVHAGKALEKSMLYRQLKIGKNRLSDRAQMMDKSVMQSAPVSSDFDSEDLPGLFRNIQGQIQKR